MEVETAVLREFVGVAARRERPAAAESRTGSSAGRTRRSRSSSSTRAIAKCERAETLAQQPFDAAAPFLLDARNRAAAEIALPDARVAARSGSVTVTGTSSPAGGKPISQPAQRDKHAGAALDRGYAVRRSRSPSRSCIACSGCGTAHPRRRRGCADRAARSPARRLPYRRWRSAAAQTSPRSRRARDRAAAGRAPGAARDRRGYGG